MEQKLYTEEQLLSDEEIAEQQTAVIRLEEKLKTYLSWSSFLEEDFEQAKAMEKEQIKYAWLDGGSELSAKNAEQYYNETYNKNNGIH